MNEKCSLDNLSRYLRVIGLLSLIIILIIVVYYYLQSNRSKILEKYESYALRDCKVYFTEGDTNIKNCDITQETSNYTGTCSYRFDGWNEFDTYTDNDGKTITYPKKVYTQTRTNTNDFNNPMFTNNCFKAYTDETCLSNTPNDNCIPPEFEYNANNVVRYDEPGTSGNTAVGTNIYGGLRYSSMQFLNTADARYNNTNLISSICDVAPNDALGSLKDKVFYMFEFNGTTNKLENIRSVALDSNQTTFSPVSSDNVLTNLPPRPTDASFYGIQYDATNRNLPIKIFKKNNVPRNVAVFKFNYMSYICTNSQIKNYMRANRIIIPEKFIKYGSSTTPNYSKNISISDNMIIKKDWRWSNYSSADFNVDYSDSLKYDLNTSITGRREEIDLLFADKVRTAQQNYDNALEAYANANKNKTTFSTDYPNLYNKIELGNSLIGIQKQNSTTKMFDYKSGYSTTSINSFISIPIGTTATKINNTADVCITFPYSGTATTKDYTFTTTQSLVCDILIVGGGGGGGTSVGGGGGAGSIIYATNFNVPSGTYTFSVGRGGISPSSSSGAAVGGSGISSSAFGATAIGGGGGGYYSGFNGTSGGSGGGCGGGGIGVGGNSPESYSAIAAAGSKTIGGTIIQSATFKEYLCNDGGFPRVWQTAQNQLVTSAGGGGGAGGVGGGASNNTTKTSTTGDGGNGKSYDITGTSITYGGGGGGGGNYGTTSVPAIAGSGGSGGGGAGGYDQPPSVVPYGNGTNGEDGKGGGGGGSSYIFSFSNVKGGNGGSGIIILRIKIAGSISNKTFGDLTAIAPSNDNKITTTITLNKSTIQSNILSSFIFLQSGTYKFSAGFEGQSYDNNILYFELIIYDTNNSVIYRYGSQKKSYEINIPQGKFYKLAFCYIYYNFINVDLINLSFKIYGYDKTLDLTNYLFSGTNLNIDYANSNIIKLFSNVKYEGNTNINYSSIITYLDDPNGIDFFNIKKFYNDVMTTREYKFVTLPKEIEDTKNNDSAIINMQTIIGYINSLKGTNVNVNYGSHLPTTSPSIYKEITIDEIFGKNFDRLITKDKVKDYNALFNANLNTIAPLTKKIYVEAVAA